MAKSTNTIDAVKASDVATTQENPVPQPGALPKPTRDEAGWHQEATEVAAEVYALWDIVGTVEPRDLIEGTLMVVAQVGRRRTDRLMEILSDSRLIYSPMEVPDVH